MNSKCAIGFAVLAGMMQPACAIILFGLDNTGNQTDPGTGVPFDGVAKVYNTSGGETRGSAVHIGGGYMLTANHVEVTTNQSFTFNGVDFYTLDTGYTPTQVASTVDLKVFKLTSTPTVGAASIYNGVGELGGTSTLVGWGRGRLPSDPINSTTVTWGDLSTIAKRWGLNVPASAASIEYSYNSINYDYESLITVLGSSSGTPAGLGANEAATTQYDSGSGLFQLIESQWYLIGIATSVETNGSSNFADDNLDVSGGDANYFVRIGSYDGEILSLVPEPSTAVMLLGASLFALRRRRADG